MPGPDSPVLTLYSRPGCHLCEDAAALLARLEREFHFAVHEQDITGQLELERRYAFAIPVIRFPDGLEVAAPIEEPALRAALARRCQT